MIKCPKHSPTLSPRLSRRLTVKSCLSMHINKFWTFKCCWLTNWVSTRSWSRDSWQGAEASQQKARANRQTWVRTKFHHHTCSKVVRRVKILHHVKCKIVEDRSRAQWGNLEKQKKCVKRHRQDHVITHRAKIVWKTGQKRSERQSTFLKITERP